MIWVDLINNWVILLIILAIILVAWARGVKVYEEFVTGAKEGFDVAILIIPYLVAILCAVAVFRAGGAMEILTAWLKPGTDLIGMHPSLVPLALLRPLSGGGSRGIMLEIWSQEGVDSLAGITASVMQGSTETTFYVLAVYCGAVAVRRTRGVLGPLLLGDLAGFITAITVSKWFFSELERLTHVDAAGRARMVDVSSKPSTERHAAAQAVVRMKKSTAALIKNNAIAKGDVLSIAEIAGVQAAKRTAELIPLAHPLALTHVKVECVLKSSEVRITASVKCRGETGVEMEALTAAAVAALTIYDMCKAADRGMVIGDVMLLEKTGGRSGSYRRR